MPSKYRTSEAQRKANAKWRSKPENKILIAQINKRWRESHPEEEHEHVMRWKREHAEHNRKIQREGQRRRYAQDPDKYLSYQKEWRAKPENEGKHNAYQKKWREKNPLYFINYRRKKKGLEPITYL